MCSVLDHVSSDAIYVFFSHMPVYVECVCVCQFEEHLYLAVDDYSTGAALFVTLQLAVINGCKWLCLVVVVVVCVLLIHLTTIGS